MATFQRMINENLAPKQKKEPEEAPSAAEVIVPHEHKEVRARYKSYRKKYRKMKQSFDSKMDEANDLFIAEHKAQDIARRIQEQNDQLLELLLDINNSKAALPAKRFSLHSPTLRPTTIPELTPNSSISMPDNEAKISLSSLEKNVVHTTWDLPAQADLPPDLRARDDEMTYPGFLTLKHEEQYLSTLDAWLDELPSLDTTKPIPAESRPKHGPSEREFALQNPSSVYNWMHKHQNSVFESNAAGSKDKDSEKAGSVRSPPPRSRGKKEKVPAPTSRQEQSADPWDEDGEESRVKDENGGSAKVKRKRDDEPYRPKGGRSSAKRKREKDDTPTDMKSVKKVKKIGEGEETA